MKRYLKLLATSVLIAVAVLLLYAPWGLALRPWDYSILRAGASIICAIALAGTFVVSTWLILKDPDVKLLEPAKVVTDDEVIGILEQYEDTAYVSSYALEAKSQVRRATSERDRLAKVISRQFEEGSLSWNRFLDLAERARTQVLRNAALVANDVQGFDRDGYARELARTRAAADGQPTEGLKVLERSLADMREILDANESLLLEMATLEQEVKRLEAGNTREDAEACVADLKGLIEQTQYYR